MWLEANILTPVGLVSLLLAACLLLVINRRYRALPLPPLAAESLLSTVAGLTSPDAPWFLMRLARQFPDRVFRLRFPYWHPCIIVADGPTARAVLNARGSEKPELYHSFDGVTAGWPSMFTLSTGTQWAHSRKGVAPAFAGTLLSSNLDHLRDGGGVCAALIERLDCLAREEVHFDAATLMIELMVDLLGETVLGGFKFGMLNSPLGGSGFGRRFLEAVEPAITEFARDQAYNPLRKLVAFALPKARRARRASRELMAIAREAIADFKRRRDSASDAERLEMDSTVLGRLVRNDKYRHEEEREADAVVFLIAGHDTTAFTLAWALYELAAHPEVARDLFADLRAYQEDVEKSPYLEAVVNETLRLWPVAAQGSVRTLAEDLWLPNGTVIPARALVGLPIFSLSRCAPIEMVDEFLPERWLGQPEDALLQAHLPFAAGKRNCIGKALALAELKQVLATIVGRYELHLVKQPTSIFFLTLKPAGGLLRVSRR